ncbi:MAG: hypothetical protein VX589_12630 [Myxococcota bacterium]|nr:hypothetical protein [Myxococcota bacterium]
MLMLVRCFVAGCFLWSGFVGFGVATVHAQTGADGKSRHSDRVKRKKRRRRVAKKTRSKTKKGPRRKKTWISNFTYGNHCGSGYVSSQKPIDLVDALCQRHDNCCKEKVVADVSVCQCRCDADLLKGARALQKRAQKLKLTAKQKGALKTIVNVFNRFNCYCKPQKFCEVKPMCRRKNGIIPTCSWSKSCTKHAITGRGGACRKPVCKKKKVCKTYLGKKFCKRATTCRHP